MMPVQIFQSLPVPVPLLTSTIVVSVILRTTTSVHTDMRHDCRTLRIRKTKLALLGTVSTRVVPALGEHNVGHFR
jgi:hypothetical protein